MPYGYGDYDKAVKKFQEMYGTGAGGDHVKRAQEYRANRKYLSGGVRNPNRKRSIYGQGQGGGSRPSWEGFDHSRIGAAIKKNNPDVWSQGQKMFNAHSAAIKKAHPQHYTAIKKVMGW